MKSTPRISDTEWEIMRVLWAKHPATANEIIGQLAAADPAWHPKTARTLLARLVRKKALGFDANGRVYAYSPLVTEADCVASASESFLTRVFGGSLSPMLAHFVERRKLTENELAELRKLLESGSKTLAAKRGKKDGDGKR